ncbi:hypothetical protein ULMA_19810 [Patiriisocius marinus]|uniref:Lipoprotein n=1 Tax=Patiriisocius marinus TaxID=1397112 RepID=A0A5J4J209_9FLAO|nr:hypothetical protein [Patiriisocius marinus]GER59873.1 hypothetical protein ULMA_19810 [Patiriisocius marinus]
MKFKHLFIVILFTGCATLKQPKEKEVEKLITKVLNDLAESNEFKGVDVFKFVENEFTKGLHGSSLAINDEYILDNSSRFFSNLKHCPLDFEKEMNFIEFKQYYLEQKKNNPNSLANVKKNRTRKKEESRLENYLQISKPFISPKKNFAIILVASSKLGGEIKAYKKVDKIWVEQCKFSAFMH